MRKEGAFIIVGIMLIVAFMPMVNAFPIFSIKHNIGALSLDENGVEEIYNNYTHYEKMHMRYSDNYFKDTLANNSKFLVNNTTFNTNNLNVSELLEKYGINVSKYNSSTPSGFVAELDLGYEVLVPISVMDKNGNVVPVFNDILYNVSRDGGGVIFRKLGNEPLLASKLFKNIQIISYLNNTQPYYQAYGFKHHKIVDKWNFYVEQLDVYNASGGTYYNLTYTNSTTNKTIYKTYYVIPNNPEIASYYKAKNGTNIIYSSSMVVNEKGGYEFYGINLNYSQFSLLLPFYINYWITYDNQTNTFNYSIEDDLPNVNGAYGDYVKFEINNTYAKEFNLTMFNNYTTFVKVDFSQLLNSSEKYLVYMDSKFVDMNYTTKIGNITDEYSFVVGNAGSHKYWMQILEGGYGLHFGGIVKQNLIMSVNNVNLPVKVGNSYKVILPNYRAGDKVGIIADYNTNSSFMMDKYSAYEVMFDYTNATKNITQIILNIGNGSVDNITDKALKLFGDKSILIKIDGKWRVISSLNNKYVNISINNDGIIFTLKQGHRIDGIKIYSGLSPLSKIILRIGVAVERK